MSDETVRIAFELNDSRYQVVERGGVKSLEYWDYFPQRWRTLVAPAGPDAEAGDLRAMLDGRYDQVSDAVLVPLNRIDRIIRDFPSSSHNIDSKHMLLGTVTHVGDAASAPSMRTAIASMIERGGDSQR